MLKGALCNVRHITTVDLPTYIALQNELENRGEYFSQQFHSPEALRREFAATGFVTDDREMMLVEDKTGAIVGSISHFKSRTPLAREIGYRLLAGSGGRGIMTEATRLMSDYLFRAYQYNRLELLMNPLNIASERIAQKCGYTYEGTLRGMFFTDGQVRDAKMYSLLRSEWEQWRGSDVSRERHL
ncbi:N-acetyltransferase [Massilia arenosa]|uniref:N-acetyltransferase n=1 Tax=Zemynaea arenosa TaxID=2561931 RepID=A0A4Y9SGD5_9BURK|nr:GNAT family protein [Massilia arenosa]TFW22447.1 N-acetyltransferase [Massilia arenosa]